MSERGKKPFQSFHLHLDLHLTLARPAWRGKINAFSFRSRALPGTQAAQQAQLLAFAGDVSSPVFADPALLLPGTLPH